MKKTFILLKNVVKYFQYTIYIGEDDGMKERENFKSRLGFILVSAGCAIGIGNVWKFPYVTGQNGGGLFVLMYLLFLLIMGVPIMTMELAVGRASRKSALLGYKKLEKPGTKWHIHGWFCMLGNLLLMMYYTTVSGWMLDYCIKFATGAFNGVNSTGVDSMFGSMLSNPVEMTLAMGCIVIFGFLVCSSSIQKGLEKVNKYMMIALLVLICVLVFHSFTLDNAIEGFKFYLLPDLNRIKEVGLGNMIVAAMNQSFFTLSLGVAAMEIFGSYMSKDHTLLSESVRIAGLDTFVAIMAGLIIFPACFSFGVQPDAGPNLIFVTLPKIFVNMPLGNIWGAFFFLFMTFASFSTVTAVFENLISFCIDTFHWSRKKAVVFNFLLVLITSMPCVLGFNVWSNAHLIRGMGVLDSEDFLVSNLLLPIGSLIYLLFCVTKYGWGFDHYLEEANTGTGLKMPKWTKNYFRYILPLLILFILFQGLI